MSAANRAVSLPGSLKRAYTRAYTPASTVENPGEKGHYERYKLLIISLSLGRIQAGPVFARRQTHSLSDGRAVSVKKSKSDIDTARVASYQSRDRFSDKFGRGVVVAHVLAHSSIRHAMISLRVVGAFPNRF